MYKMVSVGCPSLSWALHPLKKEWAANDSP